MSNRRIVRHAMFSYRGEDGVERHALRGELVELTDAELERADRLEAVAPEAAAADITAAAPVVYPKDPVEVLAAAPAADDTDEGEAPGKSATRRTRASAHGAS